MKTHLNRIIALAFGAVLGLAPMSAHGQVSLNFVLPDNTNYESIDNYYAGGADQNGAIGPNYGITFQSNALAAVNYPVSNAGNEPGGGDAMYFLNGTGDIMNVPAGFTNGFSFFYAAPYYSGSVSVYSGLNGTGTLLATLSLPTNGFGPGPGTYTLWTPIGVSFTGVAQSVNFSGTANYIGFADLTIGSITASEAVQIVQPPTNQVVHAGSTVSLTVTASDASPLSYQWLFNNTNLTDNSQITGSQSNVLTLTGVLVSNSGTYEVIVTNGYSSTNASATLTVLPATPIITWANPAPITYGVTLTTNQLNATANVPGTFVYTPTNGSIFNAGTNTLSVIFTPTDTVDYTSATNTVSLVVQPAPLTVTASAQSKPYGQTLTFGSGSTNFTSGGLQNGDTIGSVTLAVSGNGGAATAAAGAYSITPSAATGGTFTAGNYNIIYVNGTLTVTAPPAVSIAWLRSTLDSVNYSPTNTNTLFTATGVVTTWNNLTAAGSTEFFMQDATAGIAVFWSSAPGSNNLPPGGAIVQVTAPLAEFNGLLELAPVFTNPLHSVTILGTTNLPAPQTLPFDPNITGNPAIMTRQLQGSYFVASNVFLDLSTGPTFASNANEPLTNADTLDFSLDLFNPTNFTQGTNYTVAATNQSGETFTIFYNSHTDIVGQPKPAGLVTVYGVLGQFVNNEPYTSGYEFTPTRLADLSTTVTWIGGSGDWNTATNWSTGQVPGLDANVFIGFGPTITITHSSGTHTVNSILSQQPLLVTGGTLSATYWIEVNNTLNLSGGTISNTTLYIRRNSGGTFIVSSGTLDGVIVGGAMDVGRTAPGASLTVLDGMELDGTAYVGGAGGQYGGISFVGSQTLSGNGTVVFGTGSGSNANALWLANGGSTLTIGPTITVDGTNGLIGSGANTVWQGPANVGVINQGTISANVSGGTITVNAQPFSNSGTLAMPAGTITLGGNNILSGGTLSFGINSLTNYGQMDVTGSIVLGGALNANLNNGYVPTGGNAFQLISYPAFTGSFASTNLPHAVPWQSTNGVTAFTITVALPAVTWTNPAPVIYGTALSSAQLNATANVLGTFVYSPTNGMVLNAGTNTLSVVFIPTGNYPNVTNTVSLVVQPAPLTVTAANASRLFGQTNPVFSGTITGVTNGDNITANYACSAVTNSPPGPYAIIPSLIDPSNRRTNYTVLLNNGTLSVFSSATSLTWSNPAAITYGTALSTNQLDATANVAGTFLYSPTNGAVLNAGTNTLSVVFTPTDTVDYGSATDTVSLVVLRAPLSLTASNASRGYGQTNPVVPINIIGVKNGDNITASYTTTATTSSPLGTYPIVPTLVDPNNRQTNYNITLTNATLTVTQAVPVLTWAPGPITYGTALSSSQLNATANASGSFVYSKTNGTVFNVGTYPLSVVFTPADTVDYSSVTNTVNLVVSPAPLAVTANNASRAYGVTNPVFTGTIIGLTNGDNITATYSCNATTNSAPGPYSILPNVADPNNRLTNYNLNVVNGTLTIAQIPSLLTWAYPASITYGTGLNSNQLNATANVPGSFAYSPASGMVLDVGQRALSVTFTPSNATLYSIVTSNVSVLVLPAPLTVTAANASRPVGGTNQVFTGTIVGLTNGDNITATYSSGATRFSPAGTYPIVPTVIGARQTNYTVTLVNGELTVGIQLTVISSNDPAMTVPLYLVGQGNALFLTGGGTNGTSAVFSLPNAGGNANILYPAQNPQQIAILGANLYWISPNSGSSGNTQIFQAPAAGNGTATVFYNSGVIKMGSGLASDGLAVYAADEGTGTIYRFSTNGSQLTQVGSPRYSFSANNEHLSTIAASQGMIYLADSGQSAVSPQVVSIATNANTSTQVTTLAIGAPLVEPSGIAIGTNGMIYVSDPDAGNTIWQLPIGGGTPTAFLSGAPFVRIQGLAYVNGVLYIADAGADTVYAASLTTPIPIPSLPPVISWHPAAITYGAALGGSQLNATASLNGTSVAGTFVYSPSNGMVLNAGTNTLSVVFNPTDTIDYTNTSTNVSLVVFPAPLTVTAASTNRPVGQTNPVFTGTIVGVENSDIFTETFSTAATNSSPAGAYAIVPGLVDTNNRLTNYNVTLVNGTLTVGTAVSWNNPAAITYGSALGAHQLNATANVPGTYVYNPSAGSVLNAGTNPLTVIFSPTDSINYFIVTNTVSLVVSPATLIVTAANATRAYGQTNPVFTSGVLGLENGDSITTTATCAAVTNSLVGLYAIVPGLVDPNHRLTNYAVTTNIGTLTITPLPPATYSQAYTFTTLAGYPGFGSANGANAQFNNPSGVAVDAAGNIYVADTDNDAIRLVTSSGVVTTIAGLAGNAGSADGSGSSAQFNYPYGLAVGANSNIYVADTYNYTIRLITPAGAVSTIAGVPGYAGNGDGPGSAAHFATPSGVAVDAAGNVYVADSGNDTIRQLTPNGNNWTVSTIAGAAGNAGTNDGTGSAAHFSNPSGVAVDSAGNVYVADSGNNTIRKLTPIGTNWTVSTIAGRAAGAGTNDGTGTNAQFSSPYGLAADNAGNLYVGDMGNSTVRKLTLTGGNWVVSTIAGAAGNAGDVDATAGGARFNNPAGVAVDSGGNVYVADAKNALIRKVTSADAVSTLAGSKGGSGSVDGPGNDARFYLPSGTAVDASGTVFVADTFNDTIRRITSAGVVSTLAGSAGKNGTNDGAGSQAQFGNPSGVAVDTNDNVYVADTFNFTIRKITPAQVVSTIAGMAGNYGSADGSATNATFGYPSGVAVDTNGNIYVADTGNNTIRLITPVGTNWVVSTIAGKAGFTGTNDGTGTNALFNFPYSVAVDSSGRLYVADTGNDTIRLITPVGSSWIVTTVAGAAGSPGSTDGTNNIARFNNPQGVGVDLGGNLYVADTLNYTIRKIEPDGTNWVISTIGGLPGAQPGSADGTGSAARFYNPQGMAVDGIGNVYVADTGNNTIRKGVFGQYVPAKGVPYTQPPTNSQITVVLLGTTNAQWRFPWELTWRKSGTAAINLAAGFYPIEFSPVPGYLFLPLVNPVNLPTNVAVVITNQYYPTVGYVDTNNGGTLTVDIQPSPPAGAGWFFLGGTNVLPPNSSTNLVAGTYLIGFAPVSGFATPPNLSVQVADGLPTVLQITYQLAQSPPAGVNLPVPVPPQNIGDLADFPYGFNGQLETEVGFGSGVAVQSEVVLTAAHLIFNDQTLSYVDEAWWFNQQETGIFDPPPLQARGWYVLSGYAAQRTNDLKGGLAPDQSSPQSRNMDVAALYFLSPVAYGGYNGYLPSDTVPNEWLASTANKLLVGYPVDGSQFGFTNIVPGLMYETGPQRTPLALASDPVDDQQVYTASWLLSYPGNSGGPFYVQFDGYYYPAGVYLGTLYNGIVPYASAIRAIDSNVVNMIALAAALGNNGTNNSGGGVITVIPGAGIASNPGGIEVTIQPPAAVLAGASWKFQSFGSEFWSSQNPSALVISTADSTTLQFTNVTGWNVPTNQSVIISPGSVAPVTAFYTVAVTWTNPAAIPYGTPLGPNQLNATSITAGIFAYSPTNGAVLNVGTNTLSVTFTPSDSANYGGPSSTNVTLVVTVAAPGAPVIQSARLSGGSLTFNWSAITNQQYQIQSKTNLLQTNWVNLGGMITASNSSMSISETIGTNSRQFYRVVLVHQ